MKTAQNNNNGIPTVSRRLPDGRLIELIYDRAKKQTHFAIGAGTQITVEDEYVLPDGTRLVPYSGNNNLIRHEVLLLAQEPQSYGTVADLVSQIDTYLNRYVDLDDDFRTLASYYVLLTWVYEAFNEIPYLRLRGEYGSGKTRALLVIGSLCSKVFFASGASTISPIFHTLDTFRGTLVFDEADFRFSDEKAELVKIFNNGTVRGFPVLRTAITQKKEFEPRAFNVFGPKVVAMRKAFEDPALESRFFTEEMGRRPLRTDIPINLPESQKAGALTLRNQLLAYRFAVLPNLRVDESLVDPSLSPRLNQILVPLLSLVDDPDVREELRSLAISWEQPGSSASGSQNVEPTLLRLLATKFSDTERTNVSVGELVTQLTQSLGASISRPLTHRYVGHILRRRFGLMTYKSHGIYVVPSSEQQKVFNLCRRYGISPESESKASSDEAGDDGSRQIGSGIGSEENIT